MKNLIFIGMIGSEMKLIAEKAAKQLGRKYVDTDEVLTRNTGLSLHDLYTILPLDSFRDLVYRLADQLSSGEDYVIAVGDSILKNDDAISVLKKSAFSVYVKQDVESITANCTDREHPLLARGLHRIAELFSERQELFKAYSDISVSYSENAVESALKAYTEHNSAEAEQCSDPALYAFFRYYIENKVPDADSAAFADECTAALNNILDRYLRGEK